PSRICVRVPRGGATSAAPVGMGAGSAPDAFAAGFHHALATALLVVALDVAADRSTGHGTTDGRQLLALAATDLVAEQAADHGAGRGTGDSVGILGVARDFHFLAHHAAAVAEAATFVLRSIGLRAGHRGGGGQRQRSQYGNDPERFHRALLFFLSDGASLPQRRGRDGEKTARAASMAERGFTHVSFQDGSGDIGELVRKP